MAKKKNKSSTQFSADVVNKKEVIIKVDDDLSPEQEAAEVARQLMERKMLGASSQRKMIGSGSLKVKHLETKIVIKRVSKEKPVELLVCSVCQTQYEEKLGFRYYTNIGGTVKKKTNCSEKCADVVISISPDRFSKKKSNFRPAFLYKHYSDEKQSQPTV